MGIGKLNFEKYDQGLPTGRREITLCNETGDETIKKRSITGCFLRFAFLMSAVAFGRPRKERIQHLKHTYMCLSTFIFSIVLIKRIYVYSKPKQKHNPRRASF